VPAAPRRLPDPQPLNRGRSPAHADGAAFAELLLGMEAIYE